ERPRRSREQTKSGSQYDCTGTPIQEDRWQSGDAARNLDAALHEVATHRNGVAHALTLAAVSALRVVTEHEGDRTAPVRGGGVKHRRLGDETDLPPPIGD